MYNEWPMCGFVSVIKRTWFPTHTSKWHTCLTVKELRSPVSADLCDGGGGNLVTQIKRTTESFFSLLFMRSFVFPQLSTSKTRSGDWKDKNLLVIILLYTNIILYIQHIKEPGSSCCAKSYSNTHESLDQGVHWRRVCWNSLTRIIVFNYAYIYIYKWLYTKKCPNHFTASVKMMI